MSVKQELTPFSADYVAKLRRELESRGWQPDQRGDAECVDEASAAAADYIKRLSAYLATLRQQAEAMRADAERYRWLRAKRFYNHEDDRNIDAAIAAAAAPTTPGDAT